jgi:hypothetical protein
MLTLQNIGGSCLTKDCAFTIIPPPPLGFLLSLVYLIIVLSSALLLSSSASSLSWFEEDAGSAHHLLNHTLLRPHHPPTTQLSLAVANIIVVLVMVKKGCVGVPRRSCDCLVSSSSYVIFCDAAETDVIHGPLLHPTHGTLAPSNINNEAPILHPCHMLSVFCVVDSGHGRVLVESRLPHTPLSSI